MVHKAEAAYDFINFGFYSFVNGYIRLNASNYSEDHVW